LRNNVLKENGGEKSLIGLKGLLTSFPGTFEFKKGPDPQRCPLTVCLRKNYENILVFLSKID